MNICISYCQTICPPLWSINAYVRGICDRHRPVATELETEICADGLSLRRGEDDLVLIGHGKAE